jgi:DNA-binding response OmpR family regulator
MRQHDPLSPHHVLVIDDDQVIRTLMMRALRENGFRATAARDGREMWEVIDGSAVDLVLLDILLPGVNGLDLCRALRARSPLPIIMVSARGEEMDRVIGLEIGADDYIGKPFGEKELLARVRAVLRRGAALEDFPGRAGSDVLRFNGWSLHLRRRELLDPSGVIVELSGAEHDLLVGLLEQPQRVLGRQRLLELARARIAGAADRSIDVLISRLRRKLTANGAEPDLIRTVRGIGYMLAADVERE